jgi:hypothetical protein
MARVFISVETPVVKMGHEVFFIAMLSGCRGTLTAMCNEGIVNVRPDSDGEEFSIITNGLTPGTYYITVHAECENGNHADATDTFEIIR